MELMLNNLDINQSVEFDNINYILNELVTDNCTFNHSTSKTINQIGEYITSTNVNSRCISIVGYIFANSDMDMTIKRAKLLNITSPFSNIQVVVNNKYQIIGKCEELVKWAVGYDNNNNKFVKFTINILCPTTLWKELEPTIIQFDSYIDEFKFPVVIPENIGMMFGKRVQSPVVNIYNECNVQIPMKIVLTAIENVESIEITNICSDESFFINMPIKAGDTLVISSEIGNKSAILNGSNVIGSVDLLSSTWLMLNPGLNEFIYKCNENKLYSLDVQIEYYESYWGIA